MNLDSIFSLGSFGLNLFSNAINVRNYRKQENYYLRQAEINRRLGAFNAEVAERTGTESMYAIAQQTKKLLGSRIAEMSNRGITLEGSPMFVLGEIETMGRAEAQNAYFNSQVSKINAIFSAEGATNNMINAGEQAHSNMFSSIINTALSVKRGYDLAKSRFNSPLNQATQNTGNTNSSTLGAIHEGMIK